MKAFSCQCPDTSRTAPSGRCQKAMSSLSAQTLYSLSFFDDSAIQRTFYNDGNVLYPPSNILVTNTLNALSVASATEK